MSMLRNVLGNKNARTINGAVTNKSTLNANLDAFYHIPARGNDNYLELFKAAMEEDWLYAVLNMFYIRDIRGGTGKRNSFRGILHWLGEVHPEIVERIVHLVPVYGRWDDVFALVDTVSEPIAMRLIISQLTEDLTNSKANKPVSLLAKWMPSENASSKETKKLARRVMQWLHYTPREYRKVLSYLRAIIDIPEKHMSARNFSDIKYDAVPSKAMKQYRKAFMEKDSLRFAQYLQAVNTGKANINASVIYPHEIVRECFGREYDPVLETLWNNLPDYCGGRSFLPVIDVSGSMTSGTDVHNPPLYYAIGLGMYLAERNKGSFKNTFITFSDQPEFVEIHGKTLFDRIANVNDASWGYSTNIEAVFTLILQAITQYNIPESDIPDEIIIISDMEFNEATDRSSTNLEAIKQMFATHNVKLPQLTFWNVDSKTNQVPATYNEQGVKLVSGGNPVIVRAVLSGDAVTPLSMMREVLMSERYQPVLNAFG